MTTTPPASGAPDDTDIDGDSDLAALRVGALTSQSDIDKYKNIYGSTLASNYVAEQTGWDGLTKEQEEFLSRKLRDAEAEHEQEMEEVREQADALIAQIDEEERQCREKLDEINKKLDETNKKLDEIKKRPITLPDGRVVEPDANGQFTTDANGRTLTDAEKAEALRQQKQKEADEQESEADKQRLEAAARAREDQLSQLEDAKADAKNAAKSGDKSELAKAQAIVQATAPQQTHYETDATASSTLSSTDTLAALGLGGPTTDRTTSFSATLDQKDSRSTLVQSQFTGAAQGTPTPPPDDQAPVGNTVTKVQIVQPNQ